MSLPVARYFQSTTATENERAICGVVHRRLSRLRLFQPVDWELGRNLPTHLKPCIILLVDL